MRPLFFLVAAAFFATAGCTLDKTDYKSEIATQVPVYLDFEEVFSFVQGNYTISVAALNGTFYQGYNEIRLKITNNQTGQNLSDSQVSMLPIFFHTGVASTSCPHSYTLQYNTAESYYEGFAVFTELSGLGRSWKLYLGFIDQGQNHAASYDISVAAQENKNLNMTSFVGNDEKQYYIALISPQRPRVAENDLVAGIYKYNEPTQPGGTFPDPSQFSYSQVSNYTLKLDPRMPEPSMGNHSSPNNQDLTQHGDGLYHGVVNYTMTGNWTLNFILLDANGLTVKGTVVPTDFTPGIEGVKSELHIDTLF